MYIVIIRGVGDNIIIFRGVGRGIYACYNVIIICAGHCQTNYVSLKTNILVYRGVIILLFKSPMTLLIHQRKYPVSHG